MTSEPRNQSNDEKCIASLSKNTNYPKSAPIMILGEGQSLGSFEMLKKQPKFFTAKVKSYECELMKISLEQVNRMEKMMRHFKRKLKKRSISQFKIYLQILNGHPYAKLDSDGRSTAIYSSIQKQKVEKFKPLTTQE